MPGVLPRPHPLTRPRPAAILACAALLAAAAAACGAPAPSATGHPAGTGPAAAAAASSPGTTKPPTTKPPTTKPATPRPSPSKPAPAPAAAAAPGTTTTVPGAPNCPLFPADNIWNTDISQLPVAPQSAAWLASMNAAGTDLHPDFGPDQGGYPYGIPITIVTGAQPLVPVGFTYASESDRGPYPLGPATLIEGGPQAGGDRHAIIVNAQTCTLYELWETRYAASGSTAGSGAIWNLRSDALRPAGWTSADAAGLAILPGLLSYAQVQQAVATGKPITHAIRFTAEQTQSAYLWPARHEAGDGTSPDLPPMGARFRLAASFNVAGFCAPSAPYCADARAILTEMQHYGLILADNGSNWYFQGAAFPQWPDGLISLLKEIPASSFQAVNESCLMVSPDSGQASAKPGCPVG
jgi:hypothetical protein